MNGTVATARLALLEEDCLSVLWEVIQLAEIWLVDLFELVGGDAARLALDSGSGADSCDAARLVCRDVSIVSNAREDNT